MESISVARAHASRRALIAAAGVVSAMAAHVVSVGGLGMLPVAPAMWAMFIALAAFMGTRRGPFRARSLVLTTGLVLAAQGAVHTGMVFAPWAFGLSVHHTGPFITPGSALAHVVAALVLVALVAWGERLLATLIVVARALLGHSPRRRARVPVARLRPVGAIAFTAPGLRRAIPPRAPPLSA